MKKYLLLLSALHIIACNSAKHENTTLSSNCSDKSTLNDTLGLRFLKPDSFWTAHLDSQIDTYYQDVDLIHFKGIKADSAFWESYDTDRYYYGIKRIDSSNLIMVLIDFNNFCPYYGNENCASYYPTQFIKEEGIWKAKCNNFRLDCLRYQGDYPVRNAHFLIDEGHRMYYFYEYQEIENKPKHPSHDGELYVFTDSSIIGFGQINMASILNRKASAQLDQCNKIASTKKPFLKASYVKKGNTVVGIKGILNNEAYSKRRPSPSLAYYQFINHLSYESYNDYPRDE